MVEEQHEEQSQKQYAPASLDVPVCVRSVGVLQCALTVMCVGLLFEKLNLEREDV